MSRLIDIDDERFWDILFDEACVEGNQAERIKNELEKIVAFDTEKVVEQLESEKRYGSKYDSYYEENLYRGEMFENDVNNKTIDRAIDIVKKGGVE
jgi:hypothetical protein